MSDRPDWQVALIDRGRQLIARMSTSVIDCIDSGGSLTVEQVEAMSDYDAIAAMCELFAYDLYVEKYEPFAWGNGPQKCGWCVFAAGDTQEAADAATTMTLAEVREHAKTCEHSPLVAEVQQLRSRAIPAVEATTLPVTPVEPELDWMYSDDEECWNSDERFATRDEAIAAGRQYCIDESDRDYFWTGVSVPITADDVVTALVGQPEDTVAEYLYDNYGEHAADDFQPSQADIDELRAVVRDWVVRRKLTPSSWTIEKQQRHLVVETPTEVES